MGRWEFAGLVLLGWSFGFGALCVKWAVQPVVAHWFLRVLYASVAVVHFWNGRTAIQVMRREAFGEGYAAAMKHMSRVLGQLHQAVLEERAERTDPPRPS